MFGNGILLAGMESCWWLCFMRTFFCGVGWVIASVLKSAVLLWFVGIFCVWSGLGSCECIKERGLVVVCW